MSQNRLRRAFASVLGGCAAIGLVAATAASAAVPTGECAIPSMAAASPTNSAASKGLGVGLKPRPAIIPSATGSYANLVIPIDFSDAPADPSVDDPFGVASAVGLGSSQILKQYSGNRLIVGLRAGLPWLRMPQTLAHYTSTTSTDELLSDALAAAKAQSSTVFNGVSIVTLVASRPSSGLVPTTRVGPQTAPDGTTFVGAINLMNSWAGDPDGGAATEAHELGHLFGLPDLGGRPFGAPQTTRAAGFDFMDATNVDASPEPFAYMRWKQGWIDDSQVMCAKNPVPTTATITPVEVAGGLKAIAVRVSTTRALWVEVRKTVTDGTPGCGDGVVVALADSSIDSNQGPIDVRRRPGPTCPSRSGLTVNGSTTFPAAAWQTGQSFTDADTGVAISIGAKQADGSYQVTVTPPADYAHTVASTSGLASYYRLGETKWTTVTRPAGATTDPGDGIIDEYTGDGPVGHYPNPLTTELRQTGIAPTVPVSAKDTALATSPGKYGLIPDRAPATTFSIELWAKLDPNSTTGGTVFGAAGKIRIKVLPSNVQATVWAGGTAYTLNCSSALNAGVWVHLVLRRDASGAQVLRNGTSLCTTAVPSTATTTVGGTIGADGGTATPFTGLVDELAFYNTALPAATAQTHYTKGSN